MNDNIKTFMSEHQDQINKALQFYLSELDTPQELLEAMAYSLLAGGKRIRPIFLLAVISALGKECKIGYPAACAIEMIHTYSLIHDDLPAMDDDNYRRGKKTNHKVFGEAMAILAGDALLTHAFNLLTHVDQDDLPAHIQVQMVRELSLYAGGQGMVGGQVADMLGEGKALALEELAYIHEHKTGDLLVCSVRLGCHIAGATEKQTQYLISYARHIGMAFQIQDDILDEIGDAQKMGKSVGSDRKQDKTTYVSIYGLEGAKNELNNHIQSAKQALSAADIDEYLLLELADYMIKREH